MQCAEVSVYAGSMSCVFDKCRARELLLLQLDCVVIVKSSWLDEEAECHRLAVAGQNCLLQVSRPGATPSASTTQSCSLVCCTSSGALQASNAEMELKANTTAMGPKVADMRALLPASVHEQLVAGGEPGLDTEVTLMRWLRARKVGERVFLLLSCCW